MLSFEFLGAGLGYWCKCCEGLSGVQDLRVMDLPVSLAPSPFPLSPFPPSLQRRRGIPAGAGARASG